MKKRALFFITVAVIIVMPLRISAQKRDLSQYQRDSLALENYLDSILVYLREPVILKLTDTLFDMAGEIKNRRRQALALSYKVDYYYIKKDKDSLFAAIDRVRKFSKENDQPLYYYFSWQRKITYYIRENQMNLALNELNLMQADAIESGNYTAQMDSYYLKGRIYFAKNLKEEAYEAFAKAIEMIESAPEGTDMPSIYGTYLAQAHTLHGMKKYDQEKVCLDKALASAKSNTNRCTVYLVYFDYYLSIGDEKMAEHYLRLTESLNYQKTSVNGKRAILDAKVTLAHYQKRYREELVLLDSLSKISGKHTSFNYHYANIYRGLGDYKTESIYLRKELSHRDSIRAKDKIDEISEMMVLLDVNRIKAQKDKSEIELTNKLLTNTLILSAILFVLLVFITVMFIRYYRTSKKLAVSENNLGTAVLKLEEESRAKSDFLRNLSHEVRTPLNSIVGFSSLISEKFSSDPDCAYYFDIIEKSSNQLIKLVTDAVAMSNYGEEGKNTLVDVNTLLTYALEYMDIKFHKGVNLAFIPCEAENHSVMMDKEKVKIILSNLLHNASKFTKEGQVVLKADIDSKNVLFSVTDTGIGIPEAKQKEVFDYFSKVDSLTQGLGLGLPLSRHLAESMGGTLILDTTYTQGCRMILTVPYSAKSHK